MGNKVGYVVIHNEELAAGELTATTIFGDERKAAGCLDGDGLSQVYALTPTDHGDGSHCEQWSAGDVASKVADETAEDLALAIRVLSERLADASSSVSDPRTVLLDLGMAVTALHDVVSAVVAEVCHGHLEDPECRQEFGALLVYLAQSGAVAHGHR